MRPIREQFILVTGATDGIGKLVARHLAHMGAAVMIHGRNLEKCRDIKDEIWKSSGNPRVQYVLADFSSLHDVLHMARSVRETYNRLDVLINNAGLLPVEREDQQRHLSAQDYDLCFSVNYLAPFVLTQLLLPALEAADGARIVNVVSAAQEAIDFDDLMLTRDYTPMRAYARSKLALTMFTFELDQRLGKKNIAVNCVHPGSLLNTKMVREAMLQPLAEAASGAEVEVYLATAPELDGVSGHYFDRKSISRAHAQAYDAIARQRLWRISTELTHALVHP
jgi:NAD(P)-dependent dehydrogenase (short-subunit alcohol dehydrogenase family)